MLGADRVVIGVEQHPILRVEHRVGRMELRQQEGLEEPGGVRKVPFDGTAIGHRLHLAIFGAQRRRQRRAGGSHGVIAVVLAGLSAGIRSGGGVSQQAGRFHGDPPVALMGRPRQARALNTENQPRESDQCATSRYPALCSRSEKAWGVNL